MATQTFITKTKRSTLSQFTTLLLSAAFAVACGGSDAKGPTGTEVPSTSPGEDGDAKGPLGTKVPAKSPGGGGASTEPPGVNDDPTKPPPADTTDDALVVEVKVRPQSAVETTGTPIAGLSLPKPSTLPAAAASASSEAGANYQSELPNSRVSAEDGMLKLTPEVDPASPEASGLAYASFELSAESLDPNGPQTIALVWSGDAPAESSYFIALSRPAADRWDFFGGPDDGVLTVDDLAPYTDTDGTVRVLIVLTESGSHTLASVALGAPELRATGLAAEASTSTAEDQALTSTAPLPRQVNHRPSMPWVRSQGSIGSCTGFAFGGLYNYELNMLYARYGWDDTQDINQISPKWLYNKAPFNSGSSCPNNGHSMASVADFLMNSGAATEHYVPYGSSSKDDYDCSTSFVDEANKDAAVLRPSEVKSFSLAGDAGVLKAKEVLAAGHGIAFGIHTDRNFKNYESGVWNFSGTGNEEGGHAMILAGYDDDKQAFYVKNSWGYDWGDNGYVWIGYASFRDGKIVKNLGDAYYFKVEFSLDAAQRLIASMPDVQPPAHVLASDGEFTNHVLVSWDRDQSADGYKIYRDSPTNEVKYIAGRDVTSWEDSTLTDNAPHQYWVTAVAATRGGDVETAQGAADSGYRAADPLTKGIVGATSGSAGSLLTLKAEVVGTGPFKYAWDFGGGASPATSDSPNPTVALTKVGVHKAKVTVEGGSGRTSVYEFDLVIDYPASVYRHTWGGSGLDTGRSVSVNEKGNTLVAGGTQSFGAGGSDVLLMNYDAAGRLEYAVTLGTSAAEEAQAVAVDADGNAYFAGFTELGNPSRDMLFGKVDPAGSPVFVNALGGARVERADGIALDAKGNPFIVGSTSSAGPGGGDVYVARLDGNGGVVWQQIWGTTAYEYGSSLALSPDGSRVYVAAGTAATNGKMDVAVFAMDAADGTLLWSRRWGSSLDESDMRIAVGPDQNIYVACTTHADALSGGQDVGLLKYDRSGNLSFERAIAGTKYSGGDTLRGFTVDAMNNLFLVAESRDNNESGLYQHLLYSFNADGGVDSARETAGNANQTKLLALAMSPLGKLAFAGSAIGPNNYAWSPTTAYVSVNPTGTTKGELEVTLQAGSFVARPIAVTVSTPAGVIDDGRSGSEDALSYTYNPYEQQ